jgi:hypothetical protein
MSVWSMMVMFGQALVVSLIPNALLESVYPILRGMNSKPFKSLRNWLKRKLKFAKETAFVRKYASLGK